MSDALIGYTGFVGSTLLKQTSFETLYRSTNIDQILGRSFEFVVCAGASAQKWLVNKSPENDWRGIQNLISHLKTIKCKKFILISTVDVFKLPIDVYENTPADETGLHPYGLHRRLLEKFVESNFDDYLIVRLPGLVGPGLRKNVIFDLLNNNNLEMIESRGVFQFYPTVNLWLDIQVALAQRLNIIHLTAEPINVATVAHKGFGINFSQELPAPPPHYDFKTRHADLFAKDMPYQYSQSDTLLAIRAYVQSEKPLRAQCV